MVSRSLGLAIAVVSVFALLLSPALPPSAGNIAQAASTNTNSSNSVYYRQTGHYIKDAFLNYWLMNGGLTLYGYPVSEETTVGGVPVQYFQRARFEYHANSSRPWNVELSIGRLSHNRRT